jgi:phosphoenolpyruvate carboxylase
MAGRDFLADETLLTEVLGDVIRHSDGGGVLELFGQAVALGRAMRAGDAAAPGRLAALIAGLELEQLEALVQSLTRWFQLLNLAEDNERVGRIRKLLRRRRALGTRATAGWIAETASWSTSAAKI